MQGDQKKGQGHGDLLCRQEPQAKTGLMKVHQGSGNILGPFGAFTQENAARTSD